MKNHCDDCKNKSEEDIYNLQVCIRCENNPFVIDDRFDAKVKEISPEKAGELWKRGINKYLTFGDSRNLRMFKQDGGEHYLDEFIPSSPVHGQGGWTRLFPPVEDENVERIEIEIASWNSGYYSFSSEYKGGFVGKKCMLEILKETP